MNKRVLISCPIRQRAWIIPHYLDCLYNLDYDKKLIDIYWIVNNSSDSTLSLLRDYKNKYGKLYHSIIIDNINNPKIPEDERKGGIRQKVYPWLADLRNIILDKCISLDCDYLWSTDSDILFKPDTLQRLLSHNIPIVSCLLYNGYLVDGIDNAYKHPNILREVLPRRYEHITNYRIKNPQENPVGTLLEVDYSGASILISKEVCDKTIYADHPIYGEDENFCWGARQNGFKIFCDISLYVQHVMSPELLKELNI